MADHAKTSGSLALSRRSPDGARPLPRTVLGSRAFAAATVAPRRPAQPAEIAQARVFERLLQAEYSELQELAKRTSGTGFQRADPDDCRLSEDLTRLHARIDEVHDLLQALHERFPHSSSDGDGRLA